MNKKVRVRFAPSPTGGLHIGGVRTALYNYLFAKKHNGDFLLRIEDTDTTRLVPGAEEYIINSLKWAGIVPNDGIDSNGKAMYRQSEREYKSYVNILIEKGFAYYAFDTDEELKEIREKHEKSGKSFSYNTYSRMTLKNSLTLSVDEVKTRIDRGDKYVVRFNTPKNREVKFFDHIRGNMIVKSGNIDDKVLLKSDGIPTYHLANIVDDHLMEITHVIRGEEWLPSCPLHVLLYEAFGWEAPEFVHLPLILAPDGSKLSKRKAKEYGFSVFPLSWTEKDENGNEVTTAGYKEEGYDTEAFINFLALLGWNPGNDIEIMSMDEMVNSFDFSRINKAGARFDIKKAKWFNSVYLRKKDPKDLISFLDIKDKKYSEEKLIEIVKAGIERVDFAKDLNNAVTYFFEEPNFDNDFKLKNEEEFKIILKALLSVFEIELEDKKIEWNVDNIKYNIHEVCDKNNIKIGKIMPDLRITLCGGKPGPELPTIMFILGKEETINRLRMIEKVINNPVLIN